MIQLGFFYFVDRISQDRNHKGRLPETNEQKDDDAQNVTVLEQRDRNLFLRCKCLAPVAKYSKFARELTAPALEFNALNGVYIVANELEAKK